MRQRQRQGYGKCIKDNQFQSTGAGCTKSNPHAIFARQIKDSEGATWSLAVRLNREGVVVV